MKAVSAFLWFDRGEKRENEDIPLINTLLDDTSVKGVPEMELLQVAVPPAAFATSID